MSESFRPSRGGLEAEPLSSSAPPAGTHDGTPAAGDPISVDPTPRPSGSQTSSDVAAGSKQDDHLVVRHTRTGSVWTGLVVGLLVLVLVIIFIVQNLHNARLTFLAWHFTLPLGIDLLASAVGGAIIVVAAGLARLAQLRLLARRHRRHSS
jgi:uncharacterized integral membrane protein